VKLKEQRIDYILLLTVSALILIGSVMVYSSSSALAAGSDKFATHAHFLQRQVIWVMVAYVMMFFVAGVNFDRFRSLIVPSLLFCLGLLLIVMFTPTVRDTHRWISLYLFKLQPSELFKYTLIFYLAHSLSQKGRTLDDPRVYLWPYGPILAVGAMLIVAEPDLGSALVLVGAVIAMLFLAGARINHLVAAIGGSGLAVSLLVFVLGYKRSRVDSYLASLSDPMSAAYQVKQSILSLACGGWDGVGLGNGIFKQFFLPEPHTDFILASIGEEWGFVGLVVVLTLLFTIVWRGIRIAVAQEDRFRYLLAAGVTCCLAVNMTLNISVVLGLIPTTGVTLPFLSYGGSSLAVSSGAVGVLLNLSRRRVRLVS
jgi:cell division protein FtsW